MKIVFTGGGTGGHIFPVIAVARAIKEKGPAGLDLIYIGPRDNYTEQNLLKEGFDIKYIFSGKIRRYFTITDLFSNIIDVFFKVPLGIIQSLYYLFTNSPDLIFSKGGYGSVPVVIAGWILGVPIFLHESDVSPGLSNRLLSKLSKEIFVSFPVRETEYFPLNKIIQVGNPIRREILNGDPTRAKEIFKLKGEKPLILILGGSQGSQRINDLVLEIINQMLKSYEIVHQTGQNDLSRVQKEINALVPEDLRQEYHAISFLSEEELKHAYAAAKCVIARAGAGTIFELAALKKPSILIPLPESAQNHQAKNAYIYAKHKGCIVLEEGNLFPNFFLEKLNSIFELKELEQMEKEVVGFTKPNSADIIAKYLLDYLAK
jgi:UDP-N-acetylglucosamine--N-acetylmuramyl-(pentapeptide) pyrophosphoryl-undecaprenol N-acetylglucosamine transferase